MLFRCARLPLKRAVKPGASKSVTLTEEQLQIATQLESMRQTAYSAFEPFATDSDESAPNPRQMAALAGNAELRDSLLKQIVGQIDAYAALLLQTVESHPSLGCSWFYFWGSSVTERLNHAFDDYRYELGGLYTNVALLCVRLARAALEVPVGSPVTDGMEKEAYSYLCFAAGYCDVAHQLATEYINHPIGTSRNAMVDDAKPSFLLAVKLYCLGEAQLIGVEKAIRSESQKKASELLPKLAHRAAALFQQSYDTLHVNIASTAPLYREFIDHVHGKWLATQAWTAALGATCVFESNPSDGLWLAQHATELNAAATQKRSRLQPKTSPGLTEWMTLKSKTVESAVDRIRQINSLVTRAKPSAGPVALPAAQELARCKPVALPRPLVTAAPNPPPPNPPAVGSIAAVVT